MAQILGVLSFLVSIYMMIIFVRIILTWFRGMDTGSFGDLLAKITDPYLNWFRRFPALRMGFFDLSPIVALGVLSLVNRILNTLARYRTITIGIILAMVLQAIWGAVSFFLGFLIIVLILCLIAHLSKQAENSFWNIVNGISKPVIYRINRFIFRNRIVNSTTSIVVSIAMLVLVNIVLGILVFILTGILARLPL